MIESELPLKPDFFNEPLSVHLIEFVEQLPCYVCIFDKDGWLRYINPALLNSLGLDKPDSLVGVLNVNNTDGMDIEHYNLPERLKNALQGKVDYSLCVPTPVGELSPVQTTSGMRELANVCIFPIYDADGNAYLIGILFFPHSIYRGDPRVLNCSQYIDRHWIEPFDLDKLAEQNLISKNYLNKLFKLTYGLTPFQYYNSVKMENLRVKLTDTGLSIREAFLAVGLVYNGTLARAFFKAFGMSPSEYRKKVKEEQASREKRPRKNKRQP